MKSLQKILGLGVIGASLILGGCGDGKNKPIEYSEFKRRIVEEDYLPTGYEKVLFPNRTAHELFDEQDYTFVDMEYPGNVSEDTFEKEILGKGGMKTYLFRKAPRDSKYPKQNFDGVAIDTIMTEDFSRLENLGYLINCNGDITLNDGVGDVYFKLLENSVEIVCDEDFKKIMEREHITRCNANGVVMKGKKRPLWDTFEDEKLKWLKKEGVFVGEAIYLGENFRNSYTDKGFNGAYFGSQKTGLGKQNPLFGFVPLDEKIMLERGFLEEDERFFVPFETFDGLRKVYVERHPEEMFEIFCERANNKKFQKKIWKNENKHKKTFKKIEGSLELLIKKFDSGFDGFYEDTKELNRDGNEILFKKIYFKNYKYLEDKKMIVIHPVIGIERLSATRLVKYFAPRGIMISRNKNEFGLWLENLEVKETNYTQERIPKPVKKEYKIKKHVSLWNLSNIEYIDDF